MLNQSRHRALGLTIAAALVAIAATPLPAHAGDPPTAQVVREGDIQHRSPFWVEHHGSLRIRPELLLGGDLGNGASAIPQPISAKTGEDDSSTLAWASMRLRYTPTFHIGPSLRVHLGVDALDNHILGSSPNRSALVAADFLNDAAAPTEDARDGGRDSIRIRHAWAQWLAFDFMDVRLGRMPREFGLGISRNAGDCADCDFGSVVDQMRAAFTFTGFRIEAGWEFTASGATSTLPGTSGGQAVDLGQDDDVSTYTLQIGRYAATADERMAREAILEARDWAIDWSLFSGFTDQELTSLAPIEDTSLECQPESFLANGTPVLPYDCVQLFRRNAFFWRPGLWLKAELRPDFQSSLRLELEVQAISGEIEHPQRLEEDDNKEQKDFVGFGGAFELEYQSAGLGLGLDLGFATGDNGQFLGVLDGQNIVDPDDDAFAQNDALRGNQNISSFWFNRDYRLDLILFRQIIGTVTNAVYAKPWASYKIIDTGATTLTTRLDVMYAAPTRPSGTPGGGDHWGLEFDGSVILALENGLSASLGLGLLLPLDALDDPTTGVGPDPVFAAQGIISWTF
jgi:uncharacterized protein (TIGR04551 family)